MSESNGVTKSEWVDPDDAPELTDEFFDKAVWQIGERLVTPEVGMAAMRAAVTRSLHSTPSPGVLPHMGCSD
jgi:hypothetical protein